MWKIERVHDGEIEYIAVIDVDGIAVKYYSFASPELCDDLWFSLCHLADYSPELLYSFRIRKHAPHSYVKGEVTIMCE